MTTEELREARATEVVREMMQACARLCLAAGDEPAARRLIATDVNPKARFACVYRTLRVVETALHVGWALDTVGNSGAASAGRAVEALQLTKVAATAWLVGRDLPWMELLSTRVLGAAG